MTDRRTSSPFRIDSRVRVVGRSDGWVGSEGSVTGQHDGHGRLGILFIPDDIMQRSQIRWFFPDELEQVT